MKDSQNTEDTFNEPRLEDFLLEEDITEKELNKKRRRAVTGRVIAFIMAFALLISVLGVWVNVFNIPSFSFLKKSNELSKIENIQDYKKAVVTIEGSNSKGTGFNIFPDGLILTNHHVIEGQSAISIYFEHGDIFSAEIIEVYPEVDIAILDIDGRELPYLELQKKNKWSNGDHIYVIGNPLAFNRIVMEGKLTESTSEQLKITAQIEKGNSGSPVIDKHGKVIGIVFAKTVPPIGKKVESLGLVIPIDIVLLKSKNLQ